MEFHGRHLHRPHHAGQFGDAQFVGVPAVAGEVHPHRLQPRRRAVRNPLLVYLLPGDPGGEPVHHARPLTQRAHDAIADRQVIADQVELGLATGREVHPARVGDPHRPVPDLKLHLICGHGKKLTPRTGPATAHRTALSRSHCQVDQVVEQLRPGRLAWCAGSPPLPCRIRYASYGASGHPPRTHDGSAPCSTWTLPHRRPWPALSSARAGQCEARKTLCCLSLCEKALWINGMHPCPFG